MSVPKTRISCSARGSFARFSAAKGLFALRLSAYKVYSITATFFLQNDTEDASVL